MEILIFVWNGFMTWLRKMRVVGNFPQGTKKTHIEIYTYLEQTKKSYNLHARLEFRMNDLY